MKDRDISRNSIQFATTFSCSAALRCRRTCHRRDVVVVELGHTDTDYTTCLHVPSIGLVVAGDAAYNDVHLYLVESSAQNRQEWIAALDKIESLSPRAVIASHKRPENDDSPRIIEETREYIRDFDRLAGTTKTAQELYDQMLALYPTPG